MTPMQMNVIPAKRSASRDVLKIVQPTWDPGSR